MKIMFDHYHCGYKIISLAFDIDAKQDLLADAIDFLYVSDKAVILLPQDIVLSEDAQLIQNLHQFHNYDVWEIWPDGSMHLCYDTCSIENYFFITAKCNSNCVMCPSSSYSRQKGIHTNVENLIEIASHIPVSMRHLTITGGEPFLVGQDIYDLFQYLKEKFTYTDFLVLTNGRIFAISKHVNLLSESIPNNTILAIPIHGSCSTIHDAITQANGSFEQTIKGIKNLLRKGIRIELRIVISKMNVEDFPQLVDLIINELSGIEYISIIAMEMTGSAYKNRNRVWVSYKTAFSAIENGLIKLIRNGIDVKLYNFPLCTVNRKFWTICEKSITSGKVRFAAVCDDCLYKAACGGVFAGTLLLEQEELNAIR